MRAEGRNAADGRRMTDWDALQMQEDGLRCIGGCDAAARELDDGMMSKMMFKWLPKPSRYSSVSIFGSTNQRTGHQTYF